MDPAKPVCKYGAACYRKNPDHLKQFAHPPKEKEKVDELKAPNGSTTFKKRTRPSAEEEKQDDIPIAKKPKKDPVDTLSAHSLEDTKTGDSTESCEDEAGDERENVKRKFLVEMPEDFYQFWEFCKTINPSKPEMALKSTLNLELVGPYHVLASRLKGVPWDKCVLHYRYFYDPPEFLTVMKGDETTGFHIGYFRDDPRSTTCIVVSNCAKVGCDVKLEAEHIFGAIKFQISSRLEGTHLDDDKRKSLIQLRDQLVSKAQQFGLTFTDTKLLVKKRNKELVAKCFHKIGIVVPYDETTEVGYRPLPMNDRELRKLLDRIASCTDPPKRDKLFEPLQEIVTFVQFANDECDYGMGFELGIDLFCHGDQFHNVVEHLLPLAYELLQREPFAKIAQEHLKHRNQTPQDFSSLD